MDFKLPIEMENAPLAPQRPLRTLGNPRVAAEAQKIYGGEKKGKTPPIKEGNGTAGAAPLKDWGGK